MVLKLHNIRHLASRSYNRGLDCPPQKRLAACLLCHSRCLSSARKLQDQATTDQSPRPKWTYTPERMKAPLSLRKRNPKNAYRVNESQETLDDFYNRFLGADGSSLLSDEVKWLAVTHKSFDQGRRGYNDKLSFLGKRILDLQVSTALLNQTDGTYALSRDKKHKRQPFTHPATDVLPRLTPKARLDYVAHRRLAALAEEIGLLEVLRWKPKSLEKLSHSGKEAILSQGICAIIGAISLQKGGEVCARVVKDSILARIGLK